MSQYPAVQAGMRVTAGLLQAMQWLDAVKGGPTLRAATTTLAADPDLVIMLPAAGTWEFEAFLNYTGGTLGSSDLKIAMVYSAATTYGVWAVNGITTTGVTQAQMGGSGMGTAGPIAVGSSGGNFLSVDIKGVVVASAPGTLAVYWAQQTSSATATTLRQGCWLRARQTA